VRETIVVGYDARDAAQRALDRGIEEAKARGGLLVVVTVVDRPLNPEGPQNFGTLDGGPKMIPLVMPPELEPVIAAARERVDAAGVGAEYTWAVGEPADAIVGVAHERNASLVVVGAHQGGFLDRLLGGNVAAEVEREAGTEVLVVD
jgi:nucleotide-binding universal stress UspA family protein